MSKKRFSEEFRLEAVRQITDRGCKYGRASKSKTA